MPQDDDALIGVEAVEEAGQQLLDEFERRSTASASAAPSQEQEVEEGESSTPPGDAPSSTPASLSDEELAAAIQVYNWARSLSPEQIAAVDAALAARPIQPQQTLPPPKQGERVDDEELDPAIQAIRQDLDEIKSSRQREQIEQQQYQIITQIEKTTAEFASMHGLNDSEIEDLSTQLAQSGMFSALSTSYGTVDGLRRGLDFFYRQSPTYTGKEAERIKQEALVNAQKLEEKARKASAVSAAPGSVAKPEPAPTMQGRKKRANLSAVAQFISENT